MEIATVIDNLFSYEQIGIEQFGPKTYEKAFENFQMHACEFDQMLDFFYEQESEKMPDIIADEIVKYICEKDAAIKIKAKRENVQRNHNLFMVTYIFPHIMDMRNDYYKELVKSIEAKWAASFKNSKIEAGTYETIASGFQKKFLGFSL